MAAASGLAAATLPSSAEGAIVAHTTSQAVGINGEVNIDFNSDGQVDFQLDHDRVNLNGVDLDYLQIDKNDVNGAANPLAFDPFPNFSQTPFPVNGTNPNNDSQVLSFTNDLGDLGGYAVALKAGDVIGADATGSLLPGTRWDFQEGDNFLGRGTAIRANRLIDEDHGQIDQTLGGRQVTAPLGPQPEFPDVDDWIGLSGQTRYLGVRIDLNDAAKPGLNNSMDPDYARQHWYGWIGVRIDNEADATATVTGWAYESVQGMSIVAGDAGPATPGDFDMSGKVDGGDFLVWQRQFGGALHAADLATWEGALGSSTQVAAGAAHAVPEPASLAASLVGSLLALCALWTRRRARRYALAIVPRATRDGAAR